MLDKFQKPEKRRTSGPELARLEARLQTALQPVHIRPAFTSGLQGRLARNPAPARDIPRVYRYVLFSLLAILGSVLLVRTGARLAASIASALGVIRLFENQAQRKPVP